MKKIAFVVAIPGTAHSFLYNHFLQLTTRYEVHLYANFPDEDSMSLFTEIGVKCHSYPAERKISIVQDLKALWALYKAFKQERFDCVHSVTPKAGLLTAIAGKYAKIPHRIHIYTGQVWATRKGAMRRFLKFLDSVPAMLNTSLLVDGNSQRRFLIDEGVLKEKNSTVLGKGSIVGVKLANFEISTIVRNAEREKFGFNADDVVYVFLGRLNHDKGIGELYEAFNRLVVECPNAKLLFYGSDEEGYEEKASVYSNIRRNENFFYPGRTNKPNEALQAGDVFVLPTWREGFGQSVIEAQALGLPVITSDAYGVVDASVEGVTGLRCKVNDSEGLYECMKIYYQDGALRKAHGEAGRKRIEENFDNRIVSAAWVKFYKDMLG